MSCPAVIKVITPGPPGPAGPTGPAGVGSTWRQAAGAPSSSIGVVGDFYLNTSNGDIYGPKTSGGWGSVIFNIAQGQTGPQGPVGATGATGPAGANGYTIMSGSGAPSGSTGVNGDFYINTTGWIIYGPKAGGAWPAGASLIGPAGATGATGAQGPAGPTGPAGAPASYSDATPQPLGSAAAGTVAAAARADHVHALPTPAAIGAVATSDSRLSDAREWSADTVSQAEAEAGTSTTRRAFTAQRVAQALAAWWTATSTAAGRSLVTAADAAAQRTALGLGTAATTAATAYATAAQGSKADTAVQPGSLATVATSGSYADLSNKPTLGTFAAANAATPPAIGGTTPAAGSFTVLSLPQQSSAPATPANGFSLYANSSNALSWRGANGYLRVFDGTANTADRTYTLPDTSGTLAMAGAVSSSGLTMATARLLGRSSAGTGAPEELTLPTGFDLSAGALRAPAEIGIACSDETTALTTGTAKVTFRMPYAMTLTAVRLSVGTAPTGSALVVNIKEAGVSIFSTKPQIDASATTSVGSGTAAVISDAALADNAVITVDIDQIGSTVAGAGLKVWLIGRRA